MQIAKRVTPALEVLQGLEKGIPGYSLTTRYAIEQLQLLIQESIMTREEACAKIHIVAKGELGVHETPGPAATARIMEYEKHTDRGYTGSDEEAWCAKFANFVTDTAGFPGSRHANARSFLTWGVELESPILGCIVVMRRGTSETQGHVAICDHSDISNGVVRCIGGNQGDAVSVARFSTVKVLGYRAPL